MINTKEMKRIKVLIIINLLTSQTNQIFLNFYFPKTKIQSCYNTFQAPSHSVLFSPIQQNRMITPQERTCQILKIKSPLVYVIEDTHLAVDEKQSKKHHHSKVIKLELLYDEQQPQQSHQPTNVTPQLSSYYHLLPLIVTHKSPTTLTYRLTEQKIGKFLSQNEQTRKGYLYLNGKNILSLYKEEEQLLPSNEIKQYSPEQIIECFVVKVECLKLVMLNLENLRIITFYFSEFKLVRPGNIHPKESWQAAQKYFIEQLQGDFVQIKVNGTQVYHQEMNVYGQILRTRNGDDIKQKLIHDGYVQLSKNSTKYLSQQTILKFTTMTEHAKASYNGIWGLKDNKHIKKSSNQVEQVRYKKWEVWLSDKTYPKIKSLDDQMRELLVELKKLNASNIDFAKGRVVVGVVQMLFQKGEEKKGFKNLHEAVKLLAQVFVQMQVTLMNNHNNMEFLKFYSKCLTFCIFYIEKVNQFVDPKAKQPFPSNSQMEKVLKTVFKTCYLGNETFNDRLFGKKKQANYDNFSFDSAYLNGGISSYSEQSDYEQPEQSKYQNKENKKIASAHTKVRINSTYLISQIFKVYPSIVEVHWQICARSNILTEDFFQHLKKQKISADSTNMSESQRKQLSYLLKSNFGDPSLLLLTIFQRNTKVRNNALNCIYNMIVNFQGKKMINTTESVYIEKLLKSTKSSYIPKSYIIFSGLKNILYFLLFTLKYEKNLEIIEITFKTLCELCNQCSLLDKLEFEDGMKLLMENYIQPVLSFPWNIPQLQELKIVCISFLSVLVSTQKRWEQIQTNYLLSEGEANINLQLLEILKLQDPKKAQNNRLFEQIVKYFTKLPKQYFESIFFQLKANLSVWGFLSQKSLQRLDPLLGNFIAEIFKFNFDQIKLEQESEKQQVNIDEKRRTKQPKINLNKNDLLLPFLQRFIPIYQTLIASDNYTNLINILTNIDYIEWSPKSETQPSVLKRSKNFIYHIFESLTGAKLQKKTKEVYPSIKDIQENSLVRVCMIKMLGYMSFCQEFQTEEIIVPSIALLLEYAKKYKSFNTVIKVTWAISNWAKVDKFVTCIKKQHLQACINYLISQSSSDKEKIASNSTRGIGFFLNHNDAQGKFEQLHKKCRTSIINNLDHVIIKVRTNSTKTLRSMIADLNPQEITKISLSLQQNILKNNFHLQSETLMLIKEMNTPIEKRRLVTLYLTILRNLLNQSEMEYEFSQIKTIKQLRRIVLQEVIELIPLITQPESIDVFITIYAYLVDCYNEQRATRSDQHNPMMQKGQEKGEQVEKLIFNIKNKITYNEENVIATQTTLKGFQFRAGKGDVGLIGKIRGCAGRRGEYKLCMEWGQLEAISIEEDRVVIGNLYV